MFEPRAKQPPHDPRPLNRILEEAIIRKGATEFELLSPDAQQELAREFYCTPDVIRDVLQRTLSLGERRRRELAQLRRGVPSGQQQRSGNRQTVTQPPGPSAPLRGLERQAAAVLAAARKHA